MAGRCGTGPPAWFVSSFSPAALGLYAVEETAGWSCESAEEGSLTGVCRVDRVSSGDDAGVRDRVRVFSWKQDAHSVERLRCAGLDKPSMRKLRGCTERFSGPETRLGAQWMKWTHSSPPLPWQMTQSYPHATHPTLSTVELRS